MTVRRGNAGVGVGASTLAFLALCLLMISLQPFDFASQFVTEDSEGDRINQIGFLIAGFVAMLRLVTLVDRLLLQVFFAPGWIAILVVLTIVVHAAPDPTAASRSVALTLIDMILAAGPSCSCHRTSGRFSGSAQRRF